MEKVYSSHHLFVPLSGLKGVKEFASPFTSKLRLCCIPKRKMRKNSAEMEENMKITVKKNFGVPIQEGMIGLFFEDINYAADGGLYAEMLENRSFEFLKAQGDARDYYVEYDGGYGWSPYPNSTDAQLRPVMGSPLSEENPHYMRLAVGKSGAGMSNQAYQGIVLKKGMNYHVMFWARCVQFSGTFIISIAKGDKVFARGEITAEQGEQETYNRFRLYHLNITAQEDIKDALFVLSLDGEGIVEFDFVSMIPSDAVEGIFRKDLFEKLAELKPGFIRFPGGCIVEGNTLENRYRFKDSLKPVWKRRNNWNRWAVHQNRKENGFVSQYCHYNQTLGLGYYEYFLLCEQIGAKPLPVVNVGFACQYQSEEMVKIDSPEFNEFVQDALDLIEFANGDIDTKWGAVRKNMGHEEPFHLTMLGIGNEQWQTQNADFFERYTIFEKAIHEQYPYVRLIGSAGPDITSERYENAWKFYHEHEKQENFVYAVDEHYYVKPEWLLEHVDFYDNYDRKVKVFSGEYAAHPVDGMNRPDANTLEGALAEAAFLTGVERNADVVVLASYAPLFARIGYAQWSPDMIWFDGECSYATPSYYVQKLYACNMGDVTIIDKEQKQAAEDEIYYSPSYDQKNKDIIIKIVNSGKEDKQIEIDLEDSWNSNQNFTAAILTGPEQDSYNQIENPERVAPFTVQGLVSEGLQLPGYSFAVIRIATNS